MAKKLTPKREAFAREYVAQGGNGAKAARLAGYAVGSAAQRAHELVTNSDVATAVDRYRARVLARSDLSVDQVIGDIREIAAEAQDDGQWAAALKGQQMLGQILGMWVERSVSLNVTASEAHLAALVAIARKRDAEPLDITPKAVRIP